MSGDARERPPAPGVLRPFDFPEVIAETVGDGLELRVARLPRLPVVTMSLVLLAGEDVLEPGDAGLAVLAGDALEGGTASRSGSELAEALEGIGATLSIGTGWDATTVSVTCLADHKDDAAALLAEVVLRPGFPADEVERVRSQALAAIRQRAMDPGALASDNVIRLIYGEGSRYGAPLSGTPASVPSLDRGRIEAFHAARYRPRGTGFVVTGDVDPGEAATLARRHFGDWEGAAAPSSPPTGEPRVRERTVHVVDRPGAVQSEIRVGHPGVPRKHPDHFALVVLNTVLGGAFTSRLNLNLRERHGFTYGVRSRFGYRRGPGPFQVSTAVGTEVTAPAVREIVAELEGIVGPAPPRPRWRPPGTTWRGCSPCAWRPPSRWRPTWPSRSSTACPTTTTPATGSGSGRRSASAAEAARRHVRPDEATVLVVGDAERVKGALEELGLGAVEVHAAAAP